MATRVANTKHFRISKLLGEQLRFMSPGEVLPTVEELKQKYHSSQATITQALDRLRLQGLVERPPGRKRLVIADISNRTKFQVTLIRPLWSSPDYDSVTNRIYELGHEEHYGFHVYIYSDVKNLNIDHALKQADAGLVIGNADMRPEQIAAFNSSRKPIVFLRGKPPAVKASSLWVDDVAVGRMAAKHLLDLGHRRIVAMMSEPANQSSDGRLEGWKSALSAKGVRHLESLVCDCSVEPGKDSISGSYERFCKWLDAGPPPFTAIFCVAWTGALAAMRALRERSMKVPEDVSVITYASESPLCDFTSPPLTAVEMDMDRYTRQAIRIIREHLSSGEASAKAAEDILLPPRMIVRASTAKPGRRR